MDHLTSKEPTFHQPQPYWRKKFVPFLCRHINCKHFTESSYNPQKKRCTFRFEHERAKHELKEHACDRECKICKNQRKLRAGDFQNKVLSPKNSPKQTIDLTQQIKSEYRIEDLRELLELKETPIKKSINSTQRLGNQNNNQSNNQNNNQSNNQSNNQMNQLGKTAESHSYSINRTPSSKDQHLSLISSTSTHSHIYISNPILHNRDEMISSSHSSLSSPQTPNQYITNSQISYTDSRIAHPIYNQEKSVNSSSKLRERPSTASKALKKSPLDELIIGKIPIQYESVTINTNNINTSNTTNENHSIRKRPASAIGSGFRPTQDTLGTITPQKRESQQIATPSSSNRLSRYPQTPLTDRSSSSVLITPPNHIPSQTPESSTRRPQSALSRYRHRQITEIGSEFPKSPLFVSNFVPVVDPVLEHFKERGEIIQKLESEEPAPVIRRGSWVNVPSLQKINNLNNSRSEISSSRSGLTLRSSKKRESSFDKTL